MGCVIMALMNMCLREGVFPYAAMNVFPWMSLVALDPSNGANVK